MQLADLSVLQFCTEFKFSPHDIANRPPLLIETSLPAAPGQQWSTPATAPCSNSQLIKCKSCPSNQIAVHCRVPCSAQHDQEVTGDWQGAR